MAVAGGGGVEGQPEALVPAFRRPDLLVTERAGQMVVLDPA